MSPESLNLGAPLIVGFGVTGKAMARSLVGRGFAPTVIEDRPTPESEAAAEKLGVMLLAAPDHARLAAAVAETSLLLPSPGVPDHHPVFAIGAEHRIPVASEFDLARLWDDRPILAVTGTNGKTTVTVMVTDMLSRSGLKAAAVGNTDTPLVAALDDDAVEVFVVEASSFRLGHSQRFAPKVGAWLNFAPDHLDAHRSLDAYREAKASIWDHLPDGAMALANADDSVVMANTDRVASGPARLERFSLSQEVEWTARRRSGDLVGAQLVGPDGVFFETGDLKRRQPHDIANALAATAIAVAGGATISACTETLAEFAGLPHRLELIGSAGGVSWYNDSKATVPNATVVAVSGFESVVLIAGGRNKGLNLDGLAGTVPPVRAVIATGDAADEITSVYGSLVPVERAESMAEAVELAAKQARTGDVVLLSPACTSFDWYADYGERGADFSRLVGEKVLGR